ncbi:hypothetical protein GGI23_000138 [Coemansia sp. RSA 2559]|nr:hypothetical protein GGI23_000138 [Coemansia sp. RSA 2559]KAJ2869733.1 hypothetical protein GGI22_000074 [Coemansia erecta]
MAKDSAEPIEFKVPAPPQPRANAADKESAGLQAPPLKYQAPTNASKPGGVYTLEVIKQGSVVEAHEIRATATYFTFGRLPVCDFPMDHASISRYHAVLQFIDDGMAAQLVDLGSSHGSFVNKRRVQPNSPLRLGIGDQIRFGMSSRVWVLGSNDEKILDRRDQETMAKGVQKKQHGKPYARDPVKSLQSLLEENEHSYEPKFVTTANNVDTGRRGSNDEEATEQRIYHVQISLPFADHNGNALAGVARATKRQDAERLACLDALEKLDKHGHFDLESSEAVLADPYDHHSIDDGYEEDAYYDRTVQHSKRSAEAPETFASLSAKLVLVNKDIAQTEQAIAALLAKPSKDTDGDEDELDAYMTTLARSEKEGDQKKLDEQLDALRKQKDRLEMLVRLVAPDDIGQPNPRKSKADHAGAASVEVSAPTIQPSVAAPKRRRIQGPTFEDLEKNIAPKPEDEKEEESWQPPPDQIGDGRTSLNEKYGY